MEEFMSYETWTGSRFGGHWCKKVKPFDSNLFEYLKTRCEQSNAIYRNLKMGDASQEKAE